jgi:hypothetical protein
MTNIMFPSYEIARCPPRWVPLRNPPQGRLAGRRVRRRLEALDTLAASDAPRVRRGSHCGGRKPIISALPPPVGRPQPRPGALAPSPPPPAPLPLSPPPAAAGPVEGPDGGAGAVHTAVAPRPDSESRTRRGPLQPRLHRQRAAARAGCSLLLEMAPSPHLRRCRLRSYRHRRSDGAVSRPRRRRRPAGAVHSAAPAGCGAVHGGLGPNPGRKILLLLLRRRKGGRRMPYCCRSAAPSRTSPQVAPGVEVAYVQHCHRRRRRRGLPPPTQWRARLGVRRPTPRRRRSARTRRGLEGRCLLLFIVSVSLARFSWNSSVKFGRRLAIYTLHWLLVPGPKYRARAKFGRRAGSVCLPRVDLLTQHRAICSVTRQGSEDAS